MTKNLLSWASGLITTAQPSGISRQTAIGLASGVALIGLATLAIAPPLAAHAAIVAAFGGACAALPLLAALHRSQRKQNAQTLSQMTSDPLTNCLSRSQFMRRFDDALTAPKGDHKATGTLLLVKADQLRTINDDFGNDAGDDVLAALASTLFASVRKTDFVGRLDGDEFGIFLWGAAIKDAIIVADRIRSNVGHLRVSEEFGLSISVGGAILASRDMDADDGLRFASRGLDFARLGGGDRTEMIYVPASGEPVQVAGAVH